MKLSTEIRELRETLWELRPQAVALQEGSTYDTDMLLFDDTVAALEELVSEIQTLEYWEDR